MTHTKHKKIFIGRSEKVDFPKLDLFNIDAKIDTGAYTSSIHCTNIKKVIENGEKYVTFNLLDASHPHYNNKPFKLPVYSENEVKNSFGQIESRFVIKTIIRIFDKNYPIELSLTDRSGMGFPVLIGRKVLYNRFIVDVTRKDLSFKQKKNND